MVPVSKKILFLPDAGPNNPFQYQLINFLNHRGLRVVKAPSRRFLATLSAVRRHRPDVLYFDWIQSFILGKTLLVTLLKMMSFCLEISYLVNVKKIPVVHTLHNIRNHANRWVRLERIVYAWFLRKCTRVRVYAESTGEKAVDLFGVDPQRVLVAPDLPFHLYYPNETTRQESRQVLGIAPEAFVYLFFGTVKPYKGVEDLIGAFGQMAGNEDVLLIAGAGDNPQYAAGIAARAAADPKIRFDNAFIPVDRVQYYYGAADVVVLPFKHIEHSGSVDLAMSFAKTVLTLQTPYLAGLLHHQQELLFSRVEDLPALMRKAKQYDTASIGKANFRVADRADYSRILALFGG